MNKKKLVTALLKYGITAAVGAGMAGAIISSYGYASVTETADRYRILADAFTVPGVVIFLLGVLVILANEGAFEGISYAVSYAVKMLIPGLNKDQETYGDYVERRREKGPVRGFGFLFIVGGIFIAAAVVFIVLFYKVA